jgi:hypothetical protein
MRDHEAFPEKRFYTAREASQYFEGGVTADTLRELCRTGYIVKKAKSATILR